MDYEKKYNEALKRAKAAIDIAADKDLVKGVATTIFPELSESEEETTRKELLDFVKSFWADHKEALPQTSRWVTYLENQKEQKPVVTHGEAYHVDTLGTQQVIAGKVPQKPAEWSEEDNKMLDGTIMWLDDLERQGEYVEKERSWLKSLRPSWKPSEELMRCLERVMAFKHPEPEDIKGCEELLEQLQKLM